MSEMIKRVAKVIYTLRHSTHEIQARAVIEAMRVPTDEMRKTGNELLDKGDRLGHPVMASHVFDTMIDEALK